jgi:hypothetical protein
MTHTMEFHDEVETVACDDEDCFVCAGHDQPHVHYEHWCYSTLDGEIHGPSKVVISTCPNNEIHPFSVQHARYTGSYDMGSRTGIWLLEHIRDRQMHIETYVVYEQDEYHGPTVEQYLDRGYPESTKLGQYRQGVKCGTWYYTGDYSDIIKTYTYDDAGNVIDTDKCNQIYGKFSWEWPKNSTDLFEWWSGHANE